LDELEDERQKENLEELRRTVARCLGTRADTPLRMATLKRNSSYLETWVIRIGHPNVHENLFQTIKQGISRHYRKQSLLDGPDQFIPDSYRTRKDEQIDVPLDPQLYKKSYLPLTYQSVPAIIRSNHLEYLNRTMNSRTKQVAMNMEADDQCHHCGVRATTDHVMNECILATLHRKILIAFFAQKGWTQPLLREELFHAFFWWPEHIWSNNQYRQLFTMWAVLRHHAHEVDLLPRFARLEPIHFAAKAATGYRRAAMVAHCRHMRLASEFCDYAHNESGYFGLYCEQILSEKREQTRRRRGEHLPPPV